jgi:hypothetical protein
MFIKQAPVVRSSRVRRALLPRGDVGNAGEMGLEGGAVSTRASALRLARGLMVGISCKPVVVRVGN